MIRRMIKIEEEKCNGCGACANACHEGAIKMVAGKAKLTREDYCDGLGDCLPVCPVNAISFEEREALQYDEEAVMKEKNSNTLPCGCSGTQTKMITRNEEEHHCSCGGNKSKLTQWPVQIKLVPTNALFFHNANLLIAADCTAFAYGNFHNDFINNHIALVGCPKLDGVDYTSKLTEIIRDNEIKSVKIVRMEVPCCAGLENAVKAALMNSGKFIPWQIVIISTSGEIVE